jgi:hypothetical protein
MHWRMGGRWFSTLTIRYVLHEELRFIRSAGTLHLHYQHIEECSWHRLYVTKYDIELVQ